MSISLSGSLLLTGSIVASGNLTTTGTITAQTLVVQTITSSIVNITGSNIFGSQLSDRQTFTGSVVMTGSLTVNTAGTEFQVTNTGINFGNALTDTHNISGSLRITGSDNHYIMGCNLGIGTISPNQKLHVDSISGDGVYLSSFQTTSGVINTGAAVYFGFNDGGGPRDGGNIKNLKENGTIGNYATYMSFSTRANLASVAEKMRITSDGYVGISCQSPGVSLVVGTTDALRLPTGTTAQRPVGAQGLIRMNSTTAQPEWYDCVSASWVSFSSQVGTCTYDIQYLVVGGGGAGGVDRAGAGGAGGYRLACTTLVSGTSYFAIVGAGGAANSYGTQGGRSSFNMIASIGGGAGGSGNGVFPGTDGGSGGGGGNSAGGNLSGVGGAGTTGQGNAGGNGVYDAPNYGAGGGGGAGAVGANGTTTVSGNGGNGCQNSICGVSRFYAGGGGAGNYGGGTNGIGGQGGGGNGGYNSAGTSGAANSGGGGGSEGSNTGAGGGAGGSGIVIIRYCGGQRGTGGTIVSCNGHTIHIFSSSTMYLA
jgi:hypothetical protein